MEKTSASAVAQPYPWQEGNWRQLEGWLTLGRLPHALMLVGPEETGKAGFARALVQRLLCTAPSLGLACGQCKQCQLYGAGHHPNVFVLEPEEPGRAIKVDAVRSLREFCAGTAQQGGWRVALVRPVEAMNINAANAFLKTLEEPGEFTLLLLVSNRPSGVLPTIRSRCRLLTFPLPPAAAVLDWLQGQLPEYPHPEQLLAQSSGRPLRAVRIVESDLARQFGEFDSVLDSLESGRVSALAAAEKLLGLPETEALQWFQQRVYGDIYRGLPQGLAKKRSRFLFLDRLAQVRRLMLSPANANRQLLWEELLLDWRAVIGTDSQ